MTDCCRSARPARPRRRATCACRWSPAATRRYANLDLAASAPALEDVAAHVTRAAAATTPACTAARATPRRCAPGVLEAARGTVGAFLGARPDDVVVFTRNTTDALNLLAGRRARRRSCAWTSSTTPTCCRGGRAASVPGRRDGGRRRSPRSPPRCAPGPRRCVAVTGASNVTGEVLPIGADRRDRARGGRPGGASTPRSSPRTGASTSPRWDVDYVARVRAQALRPVRRGGARRPPRLARRRSAVPRGRRRRHRGAARTPRRWAAAPHRHEGGTPNVARRRRARPGLPHARAGARRARAREHERALLGAARRGSRARCRASRALRVWADAADQVAVRSFTVADRPAGYVAAYLSAEHGIGVRDGRFCAHPLLARLCGPSGEALRVSIGLGTTAEHVDRLVDALAHARHPGRELDVRAGRRPLDAHARTRASWTRSASAPGARHRVPPAAGSASPAHGRRWRSSTRLPRSS